MKHTIVCFGDSNTHGYCSSNGGRFDEEERWTCLLQKMLGNVYDIKEEGLSGRTASFTDPLFESLNGVESIYSRLMTHEPVSLLILMLGTNDTKMRFSATAANIAKGMERLIRKAHSSTDAFSGLPTILIIAPPPIDKRYETTPIFDEMGAGCAEKSKQLAPLYKEIAVQFGCHYLDGGSIDGIKMHPADYMHLDKESHGLLAQTIANEIMTYDML